jgi:CRISPR/Cas system-associated endonuclease Cas1
MTAAHVPVGGWSMPEMPGKIETDARWRLLCKEASTESDPQKLLELVREIIQLTAKEIPKNNRISRIETVTKSRETL